MRGGVVVFLGFVIVVVTGYLLFGTGTLPVAYEVNGTNVTLYYSDLPSIDTIKSHARAIAGDLNIVRINVDRQNNTVTIVFDEEVKGKVERLVEKLLGG